MWREGELFLAYSNLPSFQWIATTSVQLTSRGGRKALLAVRIEEIYTEFESNLLTSFSRKAQEFGGWNWKPVMYDDWKEADKNKKPEKMKGILVVSVYLWKDRTQAIKATDPYYQLRNDGIGNREMRPFN